MYERYSAAEVAKLLSSSGLKITRRTINYYAFEKKMFELPISGKKIFTNKEIDKIQAIVFLQKSTDFTLDQIKSIINESSLDEIQKKHAGSFWKIKSFSGEAARVRYSFQIFDGHIVADIDGLKTLINTGSPWSIGSNSKIELLGRDYSLRDAFLGVTVAKIGELLGEPIDMMLGGDILKKQYFLLDWDKKEMELSNAPLVFYGEPLPVSLVMDIPVLNFEVKGENISVFFDTSAKVSYLDPPLTQGYPSVGEVQDFYPGIDSFSTKIYKIPITLGADSIHISFGSLPNKLEILLSRAGTRGILGTEIFSYYHQIYFNLSNNLIVFKKRGVV